jgi:beta-xylosidase
MPTAVADDYFDGTSDTKRIQRHLRLAKELGVKYLRCAFSWNGIEKSQGAYDWRFWDNLVDLANQQGIELIPYVAYTPEWAASKNEEFWRQPPRDSRLFADFMYQIANRYKGKIHAWELWNEPDLHEYWTGSAENFAELVKQAAVQVRRADPQAVIVLGGMSGGPDEFFRKLISEYHVDGYVDVIAMHAYAESWDEDRSEAVYQKRLEQMYELVQATGADLWLNEMGYADYRSSPAHASQYGTNIYYKYEHTSQYAAAFLMKTHLMSLASGRLSMTGWYRIDDFPIENKRVSEDLVNYHLGLTDKKGSRKPAFFAFQFFNSLFNRGVRPVPFNSTHSPQSQSVVELFEKQDGKFVIAAWLRSSHFDEVKNHTGMEVDHRKETVSVQIPCPRLKSMQSYDALGHRITNRARFDHGWLKNIGLTGQDVFLAEIQCQPN